MNVDSNDCGNNKNQMQNDICNILMQRLEEDVRDETAKKEAEETQQREAEIQTRQRYNVMPLYTATNIKLN